jgi:flagellar hook assembly protein FlgD
VLNLAGRPVKRLQADRATAAGTHRLLWNAMGDNGLPVPAGRYLIEVTARAADGSASRALATVMLGR